MSGEVYATNAEVGAAWRVLAAFDEFFMTVRREHNVSDAKPVPVDISDLNNVSQAKAFFVAVTEGRLR